MKEENRKNKKSITCTSVPKDGGHRVSKTRTVSYSKLFPVVLMDRTLQREPADRSGRITYQSPLSRLSYSPAVRFYKSTLEASPRGSLFRWCRRSATESTSRLPLSGSHRSSLRWAAAGKGVSSSDTVAICMVISTAALCPPVIPKKPCESRGESSSYVYSLLDTLWFYPLSPDRRGGDTGAGFIVAAQFLWHCSVEDLEGRWGKVISGLHYKKTSYWKPFVISYKATFCVAIKSNFFHWYNAPHFSQIYFYLQSTVRWGEQLHIKD